MALSEYDRQKKLSYTNFNDSGNTINKAEAVILAGNDYTGVDGFESGSSQLGWESGSSFSIDTNDNVYLNNSLKFNSSNQTIIDEQSFNTSISSDGSRVTGSVKIDNQTGNASDSVELNLQDGTNQLAKVQFNGDGTVDDSSGQISTWSANNIVDVEIVLDFSNNQYDVVLNGTTVSTNTSMPNNASSSDDLQLINNTANSGQTVNAYWDRLTYTDSVEDSINAGGLIGYDTSIVTDAQDVAWYDGNENIRNYEIENSGDVGDPSKKVVLWGYGSRTRDGTVQDIIAYGNNSANTDRQNVTGTWSNTGQNTEIVQHLNETNYPTDTALDSTSNNNDGSVTGATSVSGDFDGAASFDGSDDNIDLGDISSIKGINGLAVAFWANLDDFNGDYTAIGHGSPGNDGVWFMWFDQSAFNSGNNNSISFILKEDISAGDSGRVEANANVISANTWHQVGLAWTSGESPRVYVDGNDESAYQEVANGMDTDSTALKIGGEDDNFFPGDLDAVRIYSEDKNDDWWQAEYDSSPEGGQVLFEQQAAQDTGQTISAPVTTANTATPNPSVNPGNIDVSAPVTAATGTTINPVVFTDLFLSAPVSTAQAATPNPTVSPGTATVSASTTVSSAVTPNPSVTIGDTITTPVTVGTASTPNPSVGAGLVQLAVPVTTANAVTPEPEVFTDLTVSGKVSIGQAATPNPTVSGGAVTLEAPITVGNALTPNPQINLEAADITYPLTVVEESMDKFIKDA